MSIVAAIFWAGSTLSMVYCMKGRHPSVRAIEIVTGDGEELVPEATVVEVVPIVFPMPRHEPSAPPEYKSRDRAQIVCCHVNFFPL